ncbi:hypothetical protein D4L85_13825 [Chryseolinea soli]|uniref:Uncharacterized protein n=1 Tax=Chryseolinea soli TaxID=2321403 RepID=A0A385SK12_9BACT|nr:hypothetical protein D4L85_13825 [Chryseolinea soli]
MVGFKAVTETPAGSIQCIAAPEMVPCTSDERLGFSAARKEKDVMDFSDDGTGSSFRQEIKPDNATDNMTTVIIKWRSEKKVFIFLGVRRSLPRTRVQTCLVAGDTNITLSHFAHIL